LRSSTNSSIKPKVTLAECETLRHVIQDKFEIIIESADCDGLTPYGSGGLMDAIRVYFWTLYATIVFDVKSMVVVTHEHPYIEFKITPEEEAKLSAETTEFKGHIMDLIKGLKDAPDKVPNLLTDLGKLVSEGADLIKNMEEDVKAANLGFADELKALKTTKDNISALGDAMAKLKPLPELMKKTLSDFVDVIKNMQVHLEEVQKYGDQAKAKGCKTMTDTFWAVHPGAKLANKQALITQRNSPPPPPPAPPAPAK